MVALSPLRVPRVHFVAVALAAAISVGAAPALAGDLERIEGAHKDKKADKEADERGDSPSPSASSPSTSSRHSRGDRVAGHILGGILSALVNGASSDPSTEGEAPSGPPHALAMQSYAEDRPDAYADLSGPNVRMARWGEVSVSGFSTLTPHVHALDTQMNVFLSALTVHAAVTRYYEPEAQSVRSLDLLRVQIGFNLLHGWVESAELHVTGGVLGMHGNDWTPGGSARADLRIYPIKPFSLDCVADATFFPHGPPLVEAQLLPGATFARLDLRVGMGMLYSSGGAPILGPRVQAGVRF